MAFMYKLVILLMAMMLGKSHEEMDTWKKPGCHKIGLTRKINIADCVQFSITTNACRGFCESWSFPSTFETLLLNPQQKITSVGHCCNINETEDVPISVMCLDGVKELNFKSAISCNCYHCKRY